MEDSHQHILQLSPEDPSAAYFAVFDGHGGSMVARHASIHLHRHIVNRAEYQEGNFAEAIREGFLECDRAMKGSQELKDEMAGCTAIMVLMKDNKLYCGNAGDSRCIAGVNAEAIALSIDHKPNDPLEMERIVSAGGFVEFNRVNGNLALSRALGDFIFKTDDELPQNKQIVSAEPEVQIRLVSEDMDFVLLACDGIWDVLTNQQVCDFVVDKLAANTQPEDICEQLMDRCLEPDCQVGGLGCDNMTVVLICFLHGKSWQHLVQKCQQFAKEREERQQLQDDEDCELAAKVISTSTTTTITSDGNEDVIISVSSAAVAGSVTCKVSHGEQSAASHDDTNDKNVDKIELADDGDTTTTTGADVVNEDKDEDRMDQNETEEETLNKK
jgi:protein phosphatase 2C family protein 2/3